MPKIYLPAAVDNLTETIKTSSKKLPNTQKFSELLFLCLIKLH